MNKNTNNWIKQNLFSRMVRSNAGILVVLVVFGFFAANAQDAPSGEKSSLFQNTEFQIRAGFSIGGSAPIPFPIEIRKIERYDPTLALGLEANLTKWRESEMWHSHRFAGRRERHENRGRGKGLLYRSD